MSYYNPKIYNYANLNDTDRERFYCMMFMYSTIDDMKPDYEGDELTTTLEKVFCETALDVLDNVKSNLLSTLIEFIVVSIDSYSTDVYEQDTNDYFFGFEKENFDNLEMLGEEKLRDTSDELCRTYGLSIIEDPTGKKVHYKEWKNESEGKTSYRTIYINGVEEALSRSRTRKELITNLKQIGFEVKTGKHLAIKLPNAKQYKRLYKLHGDKYSDENINKRLLDNSMINWEPFQKAYYVPYPKKNLFGFQKDYFHIMYRLGLIEKKIKPQHIHPIIREDLVYIDDISEQATYIGKHNITTIDDLHDRITSISTNLIQLEEVRNTIYNNIRICDDDYQKLELENKRDDLSSQIKALRNELKLCDKIKQRSQEIHYKLEEMDKQEQPEQGGVNNEHRWRDSRSNG